MNTMKLLAAAKNPGEIYDVLNLARAKCRRAEEEGKSQATQNRLYREFFACEDALKAATKGGF